MMARALDLYFKIHKPVRRKLWATLIGGLALAASSYSPVAGPLVHEVGHAVLEVLLGVSP